MKMSEFLPLKVYSFFVVKVSKMLLFAFFDKVLCIIYGGNKL